MISKSGKSKLKSNAKLRDKYEQLMKMETHPEKKRDMQENLGKVLRELEEESEEKA